MAILRVAVEPDVLAWARKTRGLSIEDAARGIGVAPTRLEQWERGMSFPTVKQLRKAAHVYRRAIGLLFLPEPPAEDELKAMRDFRRVPDPEDRTLLPALRLEIRLATERRQEAIELMGELGESVTEVDATASLTDNPEEVGARVRRLLDVSVETQLRWADKYVAFNSWRAAVERQGILVFQTGGTKTLRVSPSEARGFSIAERPLPVIVTNSKDAITARCFTLLHELAHILLRTGGLCDLHERQSQEEIDRVEVFCNRVAAAALVPARALEAQLEKEGYRSRREWTDAQLARLAVKFGVSWEVILLRLLGIDRTTQPFYDKWKTSRGAPPPEPSGFLTPVARAIMRNGPLFTRLVVSAYSSRKLTLVDAAYLLGAGPQHMAALTERAFDSRYVA